MEFIHNILTVARYEAKTLSRSWFFRLFAIGSMVIFTFMNIGIFSPVGDESWSLIAIPSALPFVNLYLLNIAQSVIVIFLAADFLKRDKKVDTNEVLYTRSMSNLEYVTGKTVGILRLFLSQNLFILAIGLTINIISKRMAVDILSYIEYLLILSVPTIIFSLGLAFVMMSVIRNQAVTFLLLLGYAALNMFWLWYRAGSVFDYMAFGVPAFKSGMIGFDNPWFLWNQRLTYLFLGLSMVFLTVLLFKRLPQSRLQTTVAGILSVLFFAGFIAALSNTWKVHSSKAAMREKVIETNRKYENELFPSITSADIDLLHKGAIIEASARIKFRNDNSGPIGKYLFSLNPLLTVSSVRSGTADIPFSADGHIVEITALRPLGPGESDSLTVTYSGSIDESFCYPNYTDNVKDFPYRIEMLSVNKRQAFLQDDYVLLTPEAHWYPVAGLNYYPSNPARIKVDFSKYTLNARSENNLMVISQGNQGMEGGKYKYTQKTPLTGLTIAMGHYLRDSIKIDSVEYFTCYYKGNDYYKKELAELKDTIQPLVAGIMRELETNFSSKYPFSTLSIIEAPVQFYSYPRKNTQTRAELQPSLIIVPERLTTIEQAGFGKRFARQKRQMTRSNQVITDKELQVRIFNNFMRNTFISGENFRFRDGVAMNEPVRYRLGPSFYFFRNNFHSSEYPVLNATFESHLQKVTAPGRSGQQGFLMTGNISDNDMANLLLREMSFREMLERNPGADTLRIILTIKGDYFFNLLRMKAGIEEFRIWFMDYLDKNKFSSVGITKFNEDIKQAFGFEFYPYLNDWFTVRDQPGFLFTSPDVREIVVDERSRYKVSFTASNPESAGGLFNISFRTGGPGGRGPGMMGISVRTNPGGGGGMMQFNMQGRGMEATDISRIVYLGPGEAKKITIVLDNQPRAMIINSIFSKNLPGEINIPVENITRSKERIQPETAEEELLDKIPLFSEPNEMIVDNEDSGFVNKRPASENALKKLLGIKRRGGEIYGTVSFFGSPEHWQPVIETDYYGKYIRSAVYTRAGNGERSVTWQGVISKPGYYDVYAYIGKAGNRVIFRQGGGPGGPGGGPGGPGGPPPGMDQNRDNPFRDLHYMIYHDDGTEEIVVEWDEADGGWNKLGTYYLSPDTVKVSLSNQSQGRVVIGDAIKWVLQK